VWRWDQGRLAYFNFENLRLISKAAISYNLKAVSHEELIGVTQLPFAPVNPSYLPWRNYQRIFKLMRLVTIEDGVAAPTPVARMLAETGRVTSDEFIHYIICSHTDPNPALQNWNSSAVLRWPLLFSLKYLLACQRLIPEHVCTLNEIMGAYSSSGFSGVEDEAAFAALLNNGPLINISLPSNDIVRQGRESLKFFAQLSYLMMPNRSDIRVNLSSKKAADLFRDLVEISIEPTADPSEQILALANLFADGANEDFGLIQSEQDITIESGFTEGTKSQKTHLVIERNSGLRREFFKRHPSVTCDVCTMETKQTYPWTSGVLDVHHVLPLSSGVEIDKMGTKFDDLRAICPTCHRAVHSHYSAWLKSQKQSDFLSREEAFGVYGQLKTDFKGVVFTNAV